MTAIEIIEKGMALLWQALTVAFFLQGVRGFFRRRKHHRVASAVPVIRAV